MGDVPFVPEPASTFAWQVDSMYFVLIGISALFTIPIVFLIVYFGVKYRRGSRAERKQAHTPVWVEWSWIGGLLVLILPVFVWSASTYITMVRPPPDAMRIAVVGRQWMWKFQHPTGQREINQLHIPVGQSIELMMTSEDVIHSFYVPAFRTKQDVIPGRYSTLWFHAIRTGTYHLFCAEYCGAQHANMVGSVIVMEPAGYQEWLRGGDQQAPNGPQTPESMAQAGQLLFQRNGCASCHLPDGSGQGPKLTGVFGSQVQLEGGAIVTADENYIHESILNPSAKVVHGYDPIMPSFQGQLSEDEIMQLIAYVQSLGVSGGTGPTPVPGAPTTTAPP
jgi:cytochrome c oxidase subunit II